MLSLLQDMLQIVATHVFFFQTGVKHCVDNGRRKTTFEQETILQHFGIDKKV